MVFLWGTGHYDPYLFYKTTAIVILQNLCHKKKRASTEALSVGVARLERATACTPCKNASQLHHTPIAFAAAKVQTFYLPATSLSRKNKCFFNKTRNNLKNRYI